MLRGSPLRGQENKSKRTFKKTPPEETGAPGDIEHGLDPRGKKEPEEK